MGEILKTFDKYLDEGQKGWKTLDWLFRAMLVIVFGSLMIVIAIVNLPGYLRYKLQKKERK